MAWDTNRQEGDVLTAQDWNQAVQEIKSKQSRLNIVDALDSTSSVDVLSAKQGKVLNEKINSATSTIEVVSEKVDKLPVGMYYGSFTSVENLPDAEHRDYKGYAYVPTTDAGIYYIYTTDGDSTDWVLSENKFYSTNLETNLANKSEDKAPTTKIVAEGIEESDLRRERTTALSDAQKYQVNANINNRAVVTETTTVDNVEVTRVKALGYKVLNPSMSFASQVTNGSNTVFEIKDCFENVGTSQTPFEMADNSTIKFNGGKISGKIIGNNLRVIGFVEDKTAFPNGYNLNDSDFLVASEIGMIADDSTAAAHNGSVLDAVIAKQKNLVIDKYYYFDSGHEFDYPFEIIGGGTIDTTTGSSEGFLIPTSGAAIKVSNVNLKLYHSNGSGFVRNTSCNFLIPFIEFTNCQISNGKPCVIRFIDYHAETNHWGVDSVVIANNVLNSPYAGFTISDCVIWKTCLFKNNSCYRCYGELFEHGLTNEYTLNDGNLELDCDIIVDGNIFDNTGYVSTCPSYICLALVESRKCIYTNNKIINIINVSDTGSAYDCYLSCSQVDYVGNSVYNLFQIKTTEGSRFVTIADSKKAPLYGEIYTYRLIKNNVWRINYDFIRNEIETQKNITYSDSVWEDACHIDIAYNNHGCDYKLMEGNYLETNGIFWTGNDTTNFDKLEIVGNIFKAKTVKSNRYFASSSGITKLIVKNNIFNFEQGIIRLSNISLDLLEFCNNTSNVPVYGFMSSAQKTCGTLKVADNSAVLSYDWSVVCINSSSSFTHKVVPTYSSDIYVPNNCYTKVHQIPGSYLSSNSFCSYQYWYTESTKMVMHVVCDNLGFDTLLLFDITYSESSANNDTVTIKDIAGNTILSGLKNTETIFIYNTLISIKLVSSDNYHRIMIQVINRNNSKSDFYIEFIPQDKLELITSSYELNKGIQKFDTTEGIPKYWNGANWVNSEGGVRSSGTSSNRPNNLPIGYKYFDTTLGKPIYWNGTAWVDANGEAIGLQVSDTTILLEAAASSSKTINVYSSSAITATAQNPDGTTTDLWLTASVGTLTGGAYPITLTANSANSTDPRGAKVIISNGTDVVIVNVVQNYSTT